MKTNNKIILSVIIFLSISIIGVFAFFCNSNQAFQNGMITSVVLSIIAIGIIIIIEKKQTSKEDITEECKQEKIVKNSYLDKLTGLPSRSRFFEDLKDAKGIILVDLDDFSLINSIYSKEFGDEFLKKLAHKLKTLDTEGTIYRMGGDEFSMISKNDVELKSIADKILAIIDEFYIIKDNIMIQVTATISISYKKPFIETADLALKYGKKNRLNLVTFSNSLDIFEENKTFVDVTMRLKKALKSDNIIPFFQCITDQNENIVKYEALMRIKDGEKYLLPAVFMDIAKKTKMYPDLTIRMVSKTFNYMKNKDIPFSFNLSYDDLINKRVYNFILEAISNFPNPHNIIIELLETEEVHDFDYVKHFIDEIHQRGAKVAIDDFGSGYSNFIYLEKLNVDIIKIEGEIISRILSSENAMFLVRTVVDFCKKNNIISVAEYVSHRDIFLTLKEMGVDEYQGFYFCKPKEIIE